MLAKQWKRIGLIILIIACFANVTSKLVKKVSFNSNVKSTVSDVINSVDGTVKNMINTENNKNTVTNTPPVIQNNNNSRPVQGQNQTVNNGGFTIEPVNSVY